MKSKEKDFKNYLTAQINAIEKYIYLESEKACCDLRYDKNGQPSQKYFIKWVSKHAKEFKEAWQLSICKNCKNVRYCNNCLKTECAGFEQAE